jgi:hypothetical protein
MRGRRLTIKSHPFLLMLNRLVEPVIRQEIRQALESEKSRPNLPSKRVMSQTVKKVDPYHLEVAAQANRLWSSIQDLRLALYFLRRYPHEGLHRNTAIPHMKWIHYHYSNFITGVVGTYDVILLLTNIVFQLGIPEVRCRNDVVRDNSKVVQTKVRTALLNLDRTVRDYRPSRHAYIHRGLPPDIPEVTVNFLLGVVKEYHSPGTGYGSVQPVFPHRVISTACRRLNNDLNKLEAAVCEVLDSLFVVYKKRTMRLESD